MDCETEEMMKAYFDLNIDFEERKSHEKWVMKKDNFMIR